MHKKILMVALALFTSNLVQAQVKQATLQSVFIYSTIKYMEWPSDNLAEFSITVFGESPVYDELVKAMQTKKAGARNILVRKVNSVSEITKCHILFVAQGKSGTLEKIVSQFTSDPMVIITEKENALTKGSDMNFVQKSERVGFEISENSLSGKGIKVSSAFATLAAK